MRLKIAVPHLLLILALSPGARAGAPPPDTIVVVGQPLGASRPAVAVRPSTGERHAAYTSEGTLYHAWETGDFWQSEPVADSVGVISTQTQYGGFDIQVAPDGRVYLLYLPTGRLELAELGVGGWSYETLAIISPPRTPVALAVSPVSGEPTVAWTKRGASGSPSEIWLARRSGGTWTMTLLDTTSAATLAVSVAVDLFDRPRVAWGRPRGDASPGQVLTCAIATAPEGPYVASPVDSGFFGDVSLAVDPADGEPRLAYHAYRPTEFSAVRYASRGPGLDWESVRVRGSQGVPAIPPSLAIDPAGDPFIAVTVYTNIAPEGIVAGAPPNHAACVYVETGDVYLHHRSGGVGTDPFRLFGSVGHPYFPDAASGPRALASRVPGLVDVVCRSPATYEGCAPIVLSISARTPFADVGPPTRARIALAPIVPNPALLGGRVRIAFGLDAPADAVLELHDLAGRRVAGRALGRLEAGGHALEWSPAAPRAGVYWLTVRCDGLRLGSRPAVFMR